ncbi:MAG: hypothetical protein AMXMBFR12_04860 [Candidatus Babeliales bacterium]
MENMNNKLFLLLLCMSFFVSAQYMSQLGQDQLFNERFLLNKKNGFFLDIGAHDGMTGSNTYFFEKELGWQGMCFEPLPHLFKQLRACRDCICINACVGSVNGTVPFLHLDSLDEQLSGMCDTYDPRQLDIVMNDLSVYGGNAVMLYLPCVSLMDILEQHGITHVDYLSLDTEGSELEILKTIDFSKISIDMMSVENNFHEPFIRDFLETKGFIFIEHLIVDDIFVSADFILRH